MAEDFDISFLKPFKGKHAISEVIFSLYLASPIINPARYEALVKQGGKLHESFQTFKILSGVQVNFNIKDIEPSSQFGTSSKTGNDGFSIEKYKDGKLIWTITYQPSQPSVPNQDLLTIHCVEYERWSDFFTETINLLRIISEHEELYISGYSLYYLDQFYWVKKDLPDMSHIFKKGKRYLSDLFFETKGIWNFASNTNRTVDSKLITENTNIGINIVNDNSYLIYLFHHAYTVLEEYKGLSKLIQDSELKVLADGMHDLNKDFLDQTLTDEIQILIGLKTNN